MEWSFVVGLEDKYEVSDTGLVRSLVRGGGTRILKPRMGWNGYLHVRLYFGTKQATNKDVHVIVARAFLGPPPPGHEVRHKDGNRLNNKLSNLVYGTRSQNMLDKHKHGTMPKGASHPLTKLTDQQVAEIRGSAFDAKWLSKKYGVHHNHINMIKAGRKRSCN